MRHYEIIFLVDPDQSEQVETMLARYRSIISSDKGTVHRLENWGVRKLAYPIERNYKAHYILMNIECDRQVIDELNSALRFNDAVIRSMVIRRDAAITEPSPLIHVKDDQEDEGFQTSGRAAETSRTDGAAKDAEPGKDSASKTSAENEAEAA